MNIENAIKWKLNEASSDKIRELLEVARTNSIIKGIMQRKYGKFSPDVKETTLAREKITLNSSVEEEETRSESLKLSLDRVLFTLILDESSKHVRKDRKHKDGPLSALKYLSRIPLGLKDRSDNVPWESI